MTKIISIKKTLPLIVLSLILCCVFIESSIAQNTIGIPNIVNYSKQVYNAGSQNWGIAQDANGIMYFANNKGLLTFDGTFWRTYQLPNKTIIRSLCIAEDGKIYIGSQGEVGYFFPDKKGELIYTSLNHLVPDKDFADVWYVYAEHNNIFFHSNRKILFFNGTKFTIYSSINWGYMGNSTSGILAYDRLKGLLRFSNKQWIPAYKVGKFPTNITVKSSLIIGKDSTLIITLSDGLFLLRHDTVTTFQSPYIQSIRNQNISSAALVSANTIALVTNFSGCIIIDKSGKFIQKFSKKEGIQNNNALSIFFDRDKNIWLGLDNGIDLIMYSNAIKNIFPDLDGRNSGYSSILYKKKLYLGIATGAYSIDVDTTKSDLSYTNGTFNFVKNSNGQVWNFSIIADRLLMGHNVGAFEVNSNGVAEPFDLGTGFWSYQSLAGTNFKSDFLVGTYNGLNFYDIKNGKIVASNMQAHFESARFVVFNNNTIWASHPYKGLFKIELNQKNELVVTTYKDTKKILSPNHNKIFKIDNKIILTTDNGFFEWSNKENDFIPSPYFRNLFSNEPVSYMQEDKYGNIWFCREPKIGVIDRQSKNPKTIFIPELNDLVMGKGFEHINIVDSNNVFIAADKGFFHLNYALYRKSKFPLKVVIRKVTTTLKSDGLIYGGYSPLQANPVIAYRYNSLHFESSATVYGQELNTDYCYWLDGFDKGWSDWTKKRERDYTNLPPGNYIFKVKCRNNIDNESAETVFQFSILPPWYRTVWAYLLYTLAIIGLIYFFYKRQHIVYLKREAARLAEQKRKYAEKQKELEMLHELEIGKSEKQIIELTNEKLQAEIEHKNSELASSAMNLLRKKEILSTLKDDLHELKNNNSIQKGTKEFQKILKVIDSELENTQEWERFANHFDSVHTNYLTKLKEACPDITQAELKLAAYLRLHLTSKEIAQLMNISIRGVETCRYRLRKKLGLISNEVSLHDHLIKITSTNQ